MTEIDVGDYVVINDLSEVPLDYDACMWFLELQEQGAIGVVRTVIDNMLKVEFCDPRNVTGEYVDDFYFYPYELDLADIGTLNAGGI